jgi:hypothetical protein
MLLGQNLSRPSFLFFLSTRPSTGSPVVSLLPPFLRAPMGQLTFPARSPGSPAIAHPNQRRLFRTVKTKAGGKISPSHYLKRNQPNPN